MNDPGPRSTFRRVLDVVKSELRLFARAFFRTFGACVTLAALAVTAIVVRGKLADGESANFWVLVPLALGYGAFLGFWPGVVAGALRVAWVMSGPMLLVPLVLVPFAVSLCFWIFSGVLGGLAEDFWAALTAAGAEHEWLVAQIGPFARAGPIALVFALPLFLVDLGELLLDPGVLLALLVLLLGVSGVFLLGFIPSSAASAVAVIAGYVRRVRRRHRSSPAAE